MAHAYIPTRFDVTEQVPSLSGPLSIAAWVFAPPSLAAETSPVVLVCLPGGTYTKAYYHLEVPGFAPEAYSFALHMVKQGFLVVALDHLGTGESTQLADGQELTLEVMARANAAVTDQVRARLAAGTLAAGVAPQHEPVLVGVGHSMGSFLLVAQQADHRSFAAIAPLGSTTKEPWLAGPAKRWAEQLGIPLDDLDITRDVQPKMYQVIERGYVGADRSIIRALFHDDDVPTSVIEADDALATYTPLGVMTAPQYMSAKAARIDVPIFLGNSDLDLSADFHAEPATYPLARDITLFQLAGSAHCHNFASTRTQLWDRLARWIREVNPRP